MVPSRSRPREADWPKPASLAEAQTYLGMKVRRLFPDDGWFNGEVAEVLETLEDGDGRLFEGGPFYHVRYEDADEEHLDWETLKECLAVEAKGSPPLKSRRRYSGEGLKKEKREKTWCRRDDPKGSAERSDSDEQPSATQRRRAHRGSGSTGRNVRQRYLGPGQQDVVDGEFDVGQSVSVSAQLTQSALTTQAAGPSTPANPAADELGLLRIVAIREEGLPGHIFEIKLENFMCHPNYVVPFGPHVTLIAGSNGSGKSAILQALQCCLGVTARSTGRAANMAQFIRSGAHEARVLVTIWNTGEEPYRPAVYGSKITVERRIKKHGSEFRLLDHLGRVKETTKAALEQLLDYLNINAANPLTVMTQDCSRDFLAGQTGDRKKFELFMEGTSMRVVEDNLSASQIQLARMRDKVLAAEAEVNKVKEQRTLLKKKVDRLHNMDADRRIVEHIHAGMYWSVVRKIRRQIQEVVTKLDKELPKLLQELQGYHSTAEQALQDAIEKLQEGKTRLQELRNKQQEIFAGTQSMIECENGVLREVIKLKRGEAAARQELETLMREKEDLQLVLSTGNDDQIAQQQHLLDDLNRKLQAVRQHHRHSKEEYEEWRRKYEQLRDRMDALKDERVQKENELRRVKDEYDQLRHDHHRLSSSKNDRSMKFGGPSARKVQEAVQQKRNKFHRLPIGPVGMLLSLKVDETWARAVEASIGRLLDAYICHDAHDATLLRQIFSQVGCRCMVYTLNFEIPQHNIPPHAQPRSNFLTVLRAVKCTEPAYQAVVMNILVDQAGAECAVVVKGSEAARDILYNRIAGDMVCNVYETDATHWTRSGSTVNSFPSRSNQRMTRLGTDDSTQLRELEQYIQEVKGYVSNATKELQRVEREIKEMEQHYDTAHQRQKQAALRQGKAKKQMLEIQTETQQLTQSMQAGEEEGGNSVMARLAEVTAMMAASQMELENMHGNLEQAQQRHADLQQRNQSSRNALTQLEQDTLAAAADLTKKAAKKQAAQAQLEEVMQNLKTAEQGIQAHISRKNELEQQEQQFTTQAEQACSDEATGSAALAELEKYFLTRYKAKFALDRNRAGMSDAEVESAARNNAWKKLEWEELQKELQRLTSRINAAEQEAGGNIDELGIQLAELDTRLVEQQGNTLKVKQLYHKLANHVQGRLRKYDLQRKGIAKHVDILFRKYMGRKRHYGKLEVNFEEEKLVLEVKVNGKGRENETKSVHDLKQLSGGERSFTTVCFILALAEYTDTPFRCMDEYDVFMDAVNRRIATETLLEFALLKSELQYIFLTPQDIQAVEAVRKNLERKRGKLASSFLTTFKMQPARPTPAS